MRVISARQPLDEIQVAIEEIECGQGDYVDPGNLLEDSRARLAQELVYGEK